MSRDPDASSGCDVTVVMSPRERFSLTRRSIESLYADRSVPFEFICVDGGSPAGVHRYLRDTAKQRGFRLIRRPYYLAPNEARNLAIGEIGTRYTVFIDNDVVLAPGWLGHLRSCAEETGADIVAPLVCEGEPVHTIVHMAHSDASIVVENGKRLFREEHGFAHRAVAEVRDKLVRAPSGQAEFHCMLVRTELLRRLGPFDENLKALSEHTDFCLTARAAGSVVMFEPRAVVTYVVGPRMTISDVAFFYYRWSDEWTVDSERYFHEKWQTEFDARLVRDFVGPQRRHAWKRLRRLAHATIGWTLGEKLFDGIAELMIRRARRLREARRPASGA
jgi:GT2 family glycosyltransferase